MGKLSVSRRFNVPLERAAEVMFDFEHCADNVQAIERCEILTDGPVGVGTRFRETRVMFKRETTEEMQITAWEPPHRYVVECDSCGAHITSVISLTPAADDANDTIVEMSMEYKAVSLMAKLMSPLGALMAKSCRNAFEQDLADLQAAAEGAPSEAQPA